MIPDNTTGSDPHIEGINLEIGRIDLIRTIRASGAAYSRIPVMVCTSSDDWDDVIKAAKLGIAGYLLKPYDRDVIQNKVTEVLMPKADS